MLKKLSLALVTLASMSVTACTIDVEGEEAVVRERRQLQLTGEPNVTIRTFNGSIELRSWDRNAVLVDIERRGSSADARDIEVETSESGGYVTIEARRPRNSREFLHMGGPSPKVGLIITVPRTLNVEASSGDGAIMARGLSGRVELRTGDGSVRIQGITGEINVTTGDGAVNASELDGALTLSSGDGSLDVSGRFDVLSAHSGDGSIRLEARPGSAMKREWTISSGDGPVIVRLPAELNAEIEAHTGDGPITATGIAINTPPEYRGHGVLRGQVGAGGETLIIRTGDGPISVVAK